MTPADKARIEDICYRGKRGLPTTSEESRFILRMFTRFPEQYERIHKRASERAMREVNPLRGHHLRKSKGDPNG